MALNYQDVLEQLESAGLQIDHLRIGPTSRGNPWRVKVDGEHGKPGWYILHEMTLDGGDVVIVGSYGVYSGKDPGAQKVKLQRIEMTAEQKAAYRARLQEDRKRAAQLRGAEVKQAAGKADEKWRACLPTGEHDYLTRKGIGAHGVRFAPEGMFIEYDGKGDKPYAVPVDGALVVPLQDLVGRTFGLQFILSRARHAERIKRLERDKEYWPPGFDKIGHLHLIGVPSWIILVAEGYATGATLYEATGHPVAIAFDAGNLQPVAQALHKRYPKARILICADDDAFGKCRECKAPLKKADGPTCPACGQPHGCDNAGVSAAQTASLAVGGAYLAPSFADDEARWTKFSTQGHKITDFNDLHAAEGLAVVRAQVEDKLRALGWEAPALAARASPSTGGEGQNNALRPIETQEELLERYALVYGQKGTVFDHQEHCLVALSDMRDACISRELHRRWCEHPLRKIVRVMEVGFDPAGEDPNITCNLWDKWPTTPRSGTCERLLELLRYMCMGDANAEHLFQWVLRWIAYPIQHPGAKMKSTLVIHGPQGTGKNLFFECVMAIYGRYGRVIDQSAIEDKFNDWASRKLFLIADEVVARSDLYHVKNKLKAFITGDWIRINPKNMAAYEERNHVNLVFLSNERMPVVLEEDDRRHAIIWTPEKLSPAFYEEVAAEIRAGGIAALHQYLLDLDLKGFDEHTKPPMTVAKAELIELSLDSTTRFFNHLRDGLIDGVRMMPGLSEDWFQLYRAWCNRQGIAKAAPLNKLIDAIGKKKGMSTGRKRYQRAGSVVGPHGVVIPADSVAQMPPGSSETAWLGDCIEAFGNAVRDYRGSAHYA